MLLKQAEKIRKSGADIIKISTTVTAPKHVRALARLTMEIADQNAAVMGMGSEGVLTRLFFPALGSLFTYAFLDQPTAPGQLHFDDTFRQLRLLYPSFEREKAAALARG